MRNMPNHLNSKFDYEYIREYADETVWRPVWEALLTTSKIWVDVGIIEDEKAAIIDATHKTETIIEGNEQGDEVRRIHQYKLRLDPSSDMVRLGFTEEEVRQALLQGNKKSSKSH